jgi:hypothetical protein
MKKLAFLSLLFLTPAAFGAEMVTLKITNGGAMPISPGVVYTKADQARLTEIGEPATAGFVKLCQTGNPSDRLAEVKSAQEVVTAISTPGPILPGKSVEVAVPLEGAASLQFEAMYGKSKDSCALISVNAETLTASQSEGLIASGSDEVVSTGAFADPALPNHLGAACKDSMAAVDCLRNLSMPSQMGVGVHYFHGYLPSVVSFLEAHYGASQAQELLIPASGAVRYQIFRRH